MNTSNTDLLSFEGAYSDMFVAAPLDLDYDEPNAVVEEQEVEFVSAGAAVQAVELPVGTVAVIQETVETHKAALPAQRRHAA